MEKKVLLGIQFSANGLEVLGLLALKVKPQGKNARGLFNLGYTITDTESTFDQLKTMSPEDRAPTH